MTKIKTTPLVEKLIRVNYEASKEKDAAIDALNEYLAKQSKGCISLRNLRHLDLTHLFRDTQHANAFIIELLPFLVMPELTDFIFQNNHMNTLHLLVGIKMHFTPSFISLSNNKLTSTCILDHSKHEIALFKRLEILDLTKNQFGAK